MRIRIIVLFLLILTIIGCREPQRKEERLISKEYGKLEGKNDRLGVELQLNRFKNFNGLLERTDRITGKTDIKIWLNERVDILLPPPPSEIEEMKKG